nr:c-type cytochrome [Actinomycetota bacterium]
MKAIAARRHHRQAPVILLVLALLVTGAVYAAFASSSADATVVAQTETDVETGKKLFATNCASCHGLNAEGRQAAPSLVGVGAASVYFQVSTGRMPMQANAPQAEAKPRQFGEEATLQLAAYIASLGAGPSIPTEEQYGPEGADIAKGGELFRTNCAQCHNFAGEGGALTDGKYASDLEGVTPKHVYEAMLTGPQNMPRFSDSLMPEEDKRDIVAYVEDTTSH